jgi:drug/metabolite transporter (DMT)-like permease
MLVRGVPGIVLVLLGTVWALQGVNVLHGSAMSGHGQYTALGVVALILGVALLAWAVVVRRRQGRSTRC